MKRNFHPQIAAGLKCFAVAVVILGSMGLQARAQSQAGNSIISAEPANNDGKVKTNAQFPGGMDNFYSYVANNLKLDTTCNPGKRLLVNFTVDKAGKVKKVKVSDHVVSEKMSKQLVKIFENAPEWTPAQQNGREVKEHFVCPVTFMPKNVMMAKADLPVIKK